MEGCVGAPLKARWAHKIRCFSCCNPPTKPPQYAFVSLLNGDEEQIFSHSFHQFRCCSIRNLPKDGSKFLAHDDAVESTSPSRMLPIRRRLIQQAQARGVARGILLSNISRLNLHRFRRFFFFQWLLTSISFWLKTQDQSFSHCYIMDTAYFSSPGPRLHWHRSLSLNPGSLESRNYQYKNDFQHL